MKLVVPFHDAEQRVDPVRGERLPEGADDGNAAADRRLVVEVHALSRGPGGRSPPLSSPERALLAVTTCFPRASAPVTRSKACSTPPINSTTTAISGSSSRSCIRVERSDSVDVDGAGLVHVPKHESGARGCGARGARSMSRRGASGSTARRLRPCRSRRSRSPPRGGSSTLQAVGRQHRAHLGARRAPTTAKVFDPHRADAGRVGGLEHDLGPAPARFVARTRTHRSKRPAGVTTVRPRRRSRTVPWSSPRRPRTRSAPPRWARTGASGRDRAGSRRRRGARARSVSTKYPAASRDTTPDRPRPPAAGRGREGDSSTKTHWFPIASG